MHDTRFRQGQLQTVAVRRRHSSLLLNIGWFSTGRDEAARQLLQAVQDKIQSGDINAKITFVFSNREAGEGKESDRFFELVRSYDIPLICFSHRKFRTLGILPPGGTRLEEANHKQSEEHWRVRYDREIDKRVKSFACDLCLLAGYMLIVSEELCRKYNMINLHPAPPGGPAGSWQEVIWTLIDSKADTAGAMMHLVTPQLDRGPVVSYCLFPIRDEPFAEYWRNGDRNMLFRLIRQHEFARELPLMILTLQALSRGEISISKGQVIDAQGKPIAGHNLTSQVDEEVKRILR